MPSLLLQLLPQDRGSLHAHIMLWLAGTPEEKDVVFNSITASYPCLYKQDQAGEWEPDIPPQPADGEQPSVVRELCRLVQRKQVHRSVHRQRAAQ
jgi:hypothetical protein